MTAGSLWEAPPPILFNTWKHHAGALRHRIAETARAGEIALEQLAGQLVVIGSELMDLYTGPLSPAAIGGRVVATLEAEHHLEADVYRPWIEEGAGYRVLTLAEDSSRWVLRLGEPAGRYIHLHPGRWSPATRRVRANVLKTAVLVRAYVAVHGGDPADVALVNEVRRRYLGLAPIKEFAGQSGLRSLQELLR
jgi:hypothetical protein